MAKETDKRYVGLYTLYIYADNDIEAREKAKKIETILRALDDNQASLDELFEKGFGNNKLRNVEV